MNCCWLVNEFSRVLPVFSKGASLHTLYGRSAVDMENKLNVGFPFWGLGVASLFLLSEASVL